MDGSYLVISTARDEERLIEHTLNSVIAQRIRPVEYIVVNDGSSDRTGAIIKHYAEKHPWIICVDLPNRGSYAYGNGIIEAFYAGLEKRSRGDYDFVVKLDCDLSFAADYFENLLAKFSANPKLGIASGQTYYMSKSGKLIWEDAPLDHAFGPSKMYRRECFEAIGGPIRHLGWDHVDEVMARMCGWQTRSYPELALLHHRLMGSRMGVLRGNMRHGRADYITGYHPLYFLAKTGYRFFSPPYFVGSLASFYGFFKSAFTRKKRVVNRAYIRFYRREQLAKLVQKRFWRLYLVKYKILKA